MKIHNITYYLIRFTTFEELKNQLTNKLKMTYPDFKREFKLISDSSNVTMGASLERTTRFLLYPVL